MDSVPFNGDRNIPTKVLGLNFLPVLNFESFCEVMLDGNTPHLHSLSSHTSDKLFAIGPDLEEMHPEFLELCKMVVPEILEPTLLENLMAPPADLSPLLVVLLPHADCTLLCSRIQGTTLAARRERRTGEKSD